MTLVSWKEKMGFRREQSLRKTIALLLIENKDAKNQNHKVIR